MLYRVNDIDLYAERHGAGRPLLLLHGFTGSSEEWSALIPRLAQLREAIAVDLIGHGHSAAPADSERYTMERCVGDLLALLDQLGLEQIDLLGYSMGGRVALHLAAAAPDRIGRLILESASPGIADPVERAARVAGDNTLAERIEREGIEWFANHWASIPLFASQAALPAEERAALRSRRLRCSPVGLAESLRGMGAGRQASLWDRLPTINMPTLLIIGELDAKYVSIGVKMAREMSHAQHSVIAAAGHTVHLEQPQSFAEIVVRYLEETP